MRKEDKPRAQPLDPIDPYAVISRIRLTAGKAAEVCGISRRQLCYWADKGIIKSVGEESPDSPDSSRRVYDGAALGRALLIKRQMDRGHSLHRAVQEVDRLLRARAEREHELAAASPAEREQFLVSQSQRLAEAARRVRGLAAGRHGAAAVRSLVRVLWSLPEAAVDDEAGGGLEDDPQACSRLAAMLDRVEAVLNELSSDSGP